MHSQTLLDMLSATNLYCKEGKGTSRGGRGWGRGALSMPSQNRFSIQSIRIWSVTTLDT